MDSPSRRAGADTREARLRRGLAVPTAAVLLLFAAAKLQVLPDLFASDLWPGYLVALLAEASIGLLLLWNPDARLGWNALIAFGAGLVAYLLLGPPIRQCQCLGRLASLDARDRLVLALVFLGLGLLGRSFVSVSRSLPRPDVA